MKNNNVSTTYQQHFRERQGDLPPTMDENARKNLRSTHYTLGKENGKYSTEYYTKYTKKDLPENINMRELSKELRSTHFKLG